MPTDEESRAVEVALAHVEAWSNHDWDSAERSLAEGVYVTVTTTQPIMSATDTVGVEDYMQGLKLFAQAVVPGSLVVNASVGDERDALLMVTTKMVGGPFGEGAMLTGARLYLLDEDDKIEAEQVIFFVAQG
jgi:hypothetical protein